MPDFVDPGGYGEVSGEITVPGTVGKSQSDEYNTLDEPVRETIVSPILLKLLQMKLEVLLD